jgi:hypothetical protein
MQSARRAALAAARADRQVPAATLETWAADAGRARGDPPHSPCVLTSAAMGQSPPCRNALGGQFPSGLMLGGIGLMGQLSGLPLDIRPAASGSANLGVARVVL